jgi:hypothetical protein
MRFTRSNATFPAERKWTEYGIAGECSNYIVHEDV